MLAALPALSAACLQPCQALQIPDVLQAVGSELRLTDILDPNALPAPISATAMNKVVARSAEGATLTLQRQELASRMRRLVPGLGPLFSREQAGPVTIHFSPPSSSASNAPMKTCAKLTRRLSANEALLLSDLQASACTQTPEEVAFFYDRTEGLSRARRDLAAGLIVSEPPKSTLASVGAGKDLLLRVAVGPVVVERTVSTLRPALAGRPTFVADDKGSVFSAPPLETAP